MHDLSFGKIRGKTFTLPYEVRMQNVAIYGSKGSGKTESILPMIANEQLQHEQEGALFIIGKSRISWLVYAMAKKYHRDVLFLSPSCHEGMKEQISLGLTNVADVTEHLVDFEEAMREKRIVIVDAEPYRYHKQATDIVAMILLNLQATMHVNTSGDPFFVYMDEADMYLPFSRELLSYGEQFGVGSVLFLQSRALLQARSPVLSYFLDANVRTTVLTNALVYDDFTYFKERFYGKAEDDNMLLQRKRQQLLVETVVGGMRTIEMVDVRFLSPQLFREIEEEAERERENSQSSGFSYTYAVAQEPAIPNEQPNPLEKLSKPKATPKTRKKKRKAPVVTGKEQFHSAIPTKKIFISEADLFEDDL